MKTAKEILYSIEPLIDAPINWLIIDKMKEYAKIVAEQALIDASEKATYIRVGKNVSIIKSSITKTLIITP